ncbi:ImmA/IrrE family metallo-endopeptidase [Clostridium sp.]|uniref:ImmA/IrrE family metallo-endopeptidase n=1 Tax=Clostridium sp. TaxID=1506 RepID=UPI002FDE9A86
MINKIIKDLIRTYRTSNSFILCDYLHIIILKSNLGNEVKGFFQRTPCGYNIIHINSKIDENEMNYICAHELGHTILYTSTSIKLFIENKLQIKVNIN